MNKIVPIREIENCKCEGLKSLFEKRIVASSLESKCNRYEVEADLTNPQIGDSKFLEGYQRATTDFNTAVSCYQTERDNLISKGKLIAESSDKMSIISCAGCGQYVDTVEYD